MKQHYQFNNRINNPSWSFIHIENLLAYSRENRNPSFVIYSSFECRNLIERLEFEIIVISANSIFNLQDFEEVKKRHGIQKANKKFNSLKFRYQTFTEAFSRVVFPGFELKTYNYKKAEKIKEELSQYLHTYSRTDQELLYDSSFIQEGYIVIQNAIEFVKSYLTNDNSGYYFGILNFQSLVEPMKIEFESWLKNTDNDIEGLILRLEKIVKEYYSNT